MYKLEAGGRRLRVTYQAPARKLFMRRVSDLSGRSRGRRTYACEVRVREASGTNPGVL